MNLAPEARPGRTPRWIREHVAGLCALVIGVAGFVVVAVRQDELWSLPDWQLTVPFLLASAIAATVAVVRREGHLWLPLLGVGLAASATVLGVVVVFGAVVLVTAAVILILSGVM
jgi:hypothetical protein